MKRRNKLTAWDDFWHHTAIIIDKGLDSPQTEHQIKLSATFSRIHALYPSIEMVDWIAALTREAFEIGYNKAIRINSPVHSELAAKDFLVRRRKAEAWSDLWAYVNDVVMVNHFNESWESNLHEELRESLESVQAINPGTELVYLISTAVKLSYEIGKSMGL